MEEKIKELLANYPNQRVDFEFDGEDIKWKDVLYDRYAFCIYIGSCWKGSEHFLATSIYIDDDDLVFDVSIERTNPELDLWYDEDVVSLCVLETRCILDEQKANLDECLSFFAEIL